MRVLLHRFGRFSHGLPSIKLMPGHGCEPGFRGRSPAPIFDDGAMANAPQVETAMHWRGDPVPCDPSRGLSFPLPLILRRACLSACPAAFLEVAQPLALRATRPGAA